jgi:hypothetical protein
MRYLKGVYYTNQTCTGTCTWALAKKIENLKVRAMILKVPKCEIFHLFDFNDFYVIKSL